MMLDRIFLAEEQQSLIKLRQDYENQILNIPLSNPDPQPLPDSQTYPRPITSQPTPVVPSVSTEPPPEDYDEWTCIQRELGCLPPQPESCSKQQSQGQQQQSSTSNTQNCKRSAGSDSRLETLKRFRVDKHHKKPSDVNIPSSVQSVITSGQSTIYSTQQQQQGSKSSHESSLQSSSYSENGESTENNSIDEQVQSAIDSILNLQQNTNTPLDLDSILS